MVKKLSPEIKTYILELKNGKLRRVQVPADWKVTFGPLIPGERNGPGTLALRFYEGKEHQRAIFTDVKSFRDSAIPIEERQIKVESQRVRKDTESGAKDFVVEARSSEWVNPDDDMRPPQEFKALPTLPSDEEFA